MMRKFRVTVNGSTYEVEVEELGAAASSIPAPVTTAPAAPANPSMRPCPAPSLRWTYLLAPR